MQEQQQDYRTSVFDSIESKSRFSFWTALLTLISLIFAVAAIIWGFGSYFGKSEIVNERQNDDIISHEKRIYKLEENDKEQDVEIAILKGGRK